MLVKKSLGGIPAKRQQNVYRDYFRTVMYFRTVIYFRTVMKAKCTQEARMRDEAEKLVRL